MSTLAVVEGILRDAAVPLSVREIVERAGDTLPTKSKTPDTVVARDLSMDIKKKGETSLFIRTSPGRYAMREQVMLARQADAAAVTTHVDNGHAPESRPAEPLRPENGAPLDEPVHTPVLGQALSADRAPTRPASSTSTTSSSGEMSA